jgi:hypothetical protein
MTRAVLLSAASSLLWSAAAFVPAPQLRASGMFKVFGAPVLERAVGPAHTAASRQHTVRFSTPPVQGETGTGDGAVEAEGAGEDELPYSDQQQYMEMFADDELLAKFRKERQETNDQVRGAARVFLSR